MFYLHLQPQSPSPAAQIGKGNAVTDDHNRSPRRDEFTTTVVDLVIRIAALAALLYFAAVLVYPFFSIVVWSAVLTVALYPTFKWLAFRLGGRRRLAAVLVTLLSLLIVIGPATWLALDLIQSLQLISRQLASSSLSLPPPAESVKGWPLIGDRIYQFWYLASTNLSAAFGQIVPQLKPLGGSLLRIAAGAGMGVLKFLVSIVVAGFLLPLGSSLAGGIKRFARRLASKRGEEFVNLGGATIRSVSLGVIGISVVQALLAGIGVIVAGVPGPSLITSAVLICGIIQIGPAIILIPLIIWSWTAMETTPALLFTAYMMVVNLFDNVMRPLVIGRGLTTPIPVTLVGVIGGTLAYGISGLFLGPIVLAVTWDLLVAWTSDPEVRRGGGNG
jgi:predicted PurR-regulated permease PerM